MRILGNNISNKLNIIPNTPDNLNNQKSKILVLLRLSISKSFWVSQQVELTLKIGASRGAHNHILVNIIVKVSSIKCISAVGVIKPALS